MHIFTITNKGGMKTENNHYKRLLIESLQTKKRLYLEEVKEIFQFDDENKLNQILTEFKYEYPVEFVEVDQGICKVILITLKQ